jgi:alpha-galactosidase
MEFGLWVEPEMANPDSDVVRAHPDWVLGPRAQSWRGQVVLDVANSGAFAYLQERLSALVDEIGIAYFKWDHNRDVHEAVGTTTGRAGIHAQTAAVYALLTSSSGATRASRSSPARRVAGGWTSASSNAPTGCGRPTATTRRAADDPTLDGPAPAARAHRRPRAGPPVAHTTHARRRSACARSRRSSVTPAWSGT